MINRIHKALSVGILSICLLLLAAIPTFAHVIVYPSTAGIGSTQEFRVSVPTEKNSPTVSLKLLIPQGLEDVMPNSKPGWTISVKKQGSGENASVTEIDWTGGSIPPDQRDDFLFQAQVPAQPTTLKWKAYQTFADGSVVAWDHVPTSNPEDDSAPPPYSQTMVVNDLTTTSTPQSGQDLKTVTTLAGLAGGISILALLIAFLALRQRKK